MTSLTVWMVWVCLAVSVSSSASYLHRLTTLARHTPSQWHRCETLVHRRRCPMGLSSPWRWCLSVVDVLWRWIAWLLRTTNRLCRQRHVTESHHSRYGLQHTTTRSHCHLYQSINEHHKVDITFAARHQHVSAQKIMTVVIRGFTTGLLQLHHKFTNSYHRTSIQCYSIPIEIKLQKVSIFPHFYPQNTKRGRE